MREINLIASFNAELVKRKLTANLSTKVKSIDGFDVLSNLHTLISKTRDTKDIVIVWQTLEHFWYSTENIMSFFDKLCEQIKILSKVSTAVIIPLIHRSYLLSFGDIKGKSLATEIDILSINKKILGLGEKFSNIIPFNVENIMKSFSSEVFSPEMWYYTKNPYSNTFCKHLAERLTSVINIINHKSKKVIILDLDNTLWGDNLGDVGYDKIILGGHSAKGEAFLDFQLYLKTLKQKGILLAISSKNDEKNVMEVFAKNSAMQLKKDDFISMRINWKDKAQNILEILEEVNLLPESAVFIDDNISERVRVRESIPGLLIPELPSKPWNYIETISKECEFETFTNTKEDTQRTELFLMEREREKLKKSFVGEDDWLKYIEITCTIKRLTSQNQHDILRVLQLFNKTNQFNTQTRRFSQNELLELISSDKNELWYFDVSDKFGNYGIVGIASISFEKKTKKIFIQDLILSCRVFGKHIEHGMISFILKRSKGYKPYIKFKKTEKNAPTLHFLNSFCKEDSSGEYIITNTDIINEKTNYLIIKVQAE